MADVREVPLCGALNLRFDARNAVAAQAVADVLGAALPAPNAWTPATNAQVLSQAYDEWLIITPDGTQHALAALLRNALSSAHHAITDVSDLRVAFALDGPQARDVLQKGCAIDLHPRVFNTGACVMTALARVRVTLREMGAAPAYEVLVERSYAEYLQNWLLDAALEYGQAG